MKRTAILLWKHDMYVSHQLTRPMYSRCSLSKQVILTRWYSYMSVNVHHTKNNELLRFIWYIDTSFFFPAFLYLSVKSFMNIMCLITVVAASVLISLNFINIVSFQIWPTCSIFLTWKLFVLSHFASRLQQHREKHQVSDDHTCMIYRFTPPPKIYTLQ